MPRWLCSSNALLLALLHPMQARRAAGRGGEVVARAIVLAKACREAEKDGGQKKERKHQRGAGKLGGLKFF